MSALKWHLCDRLSEIRPPLQIVTIPIAYELDEERGHREREHQLQRDVETDQDARRPDPNLPLTGLSYALS